MSQFKNKKIDIIMPRRIGDALLNIPMLMCWKQLNQKYNDNNKIRIITQPFLSKLYSSFEIFKNRRMTVGRRILSHLNPADIAFFTETLNINWGYAAKIKYGLTNPSKYIIKFDRELPFMNIENLSEHLPEELINFLQDKYKFGQYTISTFGILLEMGYPPVEIMDTFDFKSEYLNLDDFKGFKHPIMDEKYIVFCMEAAYGKKGDANRRWNENYYVEIANKCYQDYNLKSVFVGINKDFKLPDNPNFVDLRKELNLFELAQVLKSAEYYIGNDTAPLHIANIMQTPSIGAYFMQHSLTDFSPLFPDLNMQVYCPQSPDDIYQIFKEKYKP